MIILSSVRYTLITLQKIGFIMRMNQLPPNAAASLTVCPGSPNSSTMAWG